MSMSPLSWRRSECGPRVPSTVRVSLPRVREILSTVVILQPGWNTVQLDFALEPGLDYALTAEAEELGLWRDNAAGELSYPYDVGGMATIQSTTIPNAAGLGYYYFFYDWTVRSQGITCTSEPVVAFVEVVDGVSGCTYAFAANYNALATLDDGWSYRLPDPAAVNYDPDATVDDGSCALQCASDINGDGQIGAPDLLTLLSQWGSACD